MELVSLETEEENNCVKKILKDAGIKKHCQNERFLSPGMQKLSGKLSGFIWHSLNMFGTPDFTHWANGEPLTYKTGWAKGQPAQFPYQACGLYEWFNVHNARDYWKTKIYFWCRFNGKWGDFPCDWKALYVCETNQVDPCKQGAREIVKCSTPMLTKPSWFSGQFFPQADKVCRLGMQPARCTRLARCILMLLPLRGFSFN